MRIIEKWLDDCAYEDWKQNRKGPYNLHERLADNLTEQEFEYVSFCVGWIEAVSDLMERDGVFDDEPITAGGIKEFHKAMMKEGGYDNG